MKTKKITIILSVSIIIVIVAYLFFQISKSRSFQFFGSLSNRVETNQKMIALTFDDAPFGYTEEVLKILNESNVKATFYAIGKYMEEYPARVKEIVEQGHELGNHSFSHERFLFKSTSYVKQEIESTNLLIRGSGYTGDITFRPPFAKKLFSLPLYLQKNNIKTLMWDVEPDTYYPGDSKKIIEYTLANTKPGSIILLHPFCEESCAADREALPSIISELRRSGYTFVTVSELLKYST